MHQLRYQQLFAPKLRLVTKKKRRPTTPTTHHLDAEVFVSNPVIRAKLERALSSQMEKRYIAIVGGKKRRRRVYGWCMSFSAIVNVVAWMGFFIWVVMPRQLPPKIEGDIIISVSFLSPDMLPPLRQPDTLESPPPVPKEIAPVEEPPEETVDIQEEVPIEPPDVSAEVPSDDPPVEPEPILDEPPMIIQDEADKPLVDPLEIDALHDAAEENRTQNTVNDPIALNTLQQRKTEPEKAQAAKPDPTDLPPLPSQSDAVPAGDLPVDVAPALAVSDLHQKRKWENQKPQDTITALNLPDFRSKSGDAKAKNRQTTNATLQVIAFQKEGRNSSAQKPNTTGAPLDVSDLQAKRKSKTSPQAAVKPVVAFQPLRVKKGGQKRFKVTPTTTDLNSQTLPKLLTQKISPEFPPVEDIDINTCEVVLWLWVEKDGKPGEIRVHKVTPKMDEKKARAFRLAAIEAVKEARFAPARRGENPERVLVKISVWFDRPQQ